MSAAIASQIGGDAREDAGLPQGQAGADDEDEVADQVEVDETHGLEAELEARGQG